MPDYLGLTQFEHGSPDRMGVLLVNLGTPEDPSPAAVRRFLAEFLSDPRVVETSRWLWLMILHGVILRFRPRRSAHAYQQIWTPAGSPLMVHSVELSRRLQESLAQRFGPDITVELAMSYGNPSIRDTLERMQANGVRRVVVLPLYPQYSGTTTASVFDRVSRVFNRFRWVPELRFITDYHDDPGYIAAIASSIRARWESHGQSHLLFSFHGIPRSNLLAGDPYYCQCQKTARLVAEQLGLPAGEWSIAFQSQVGRAEWLRPYTDQLLVDYAQGPHRRLSVVCPGFATDCLETLEEIAIRNRELFMQKGGETYDYIPALNATAAHVALLTDVIARHASGWSQTLRDPQTRSRALGLGATR